MVVSLSEQISPSGRLSFLNDLMNHVNESIFLILAVLIPLLNTAACHWEFPILFTNRQMHIWTFHRLHLHIYDFSFWVHTFGYCLFISNVLDLLVCI